MPWPKDQRPALLRLARDAIASAVQGQAPPAFEGVDPPCHGAFVTLHKGHELRGCIGSFAPSTSTVETIQEMARAAALRDPRFPALRPEELARCHIEISLLSPLRAAHADEIDVGRHGLCISRGFQRGVLLPQVARDRGWDRETFLRQTCIKAGLPADAWRDADCTIEVFEASVFSE